MNSMKLSSRLAWGFGTLIALLLACVVVALVKVGGLGSTVSVLTDERLPTLQLLGDIALRVSDNSRITRNVILQTEEDDIARNMAALERNLAANGKVYELLDKELTDADDKALLKKMTALRAAFNDYNKRVIALGVTNK